MGTSVPASQSSALSGIPVGGEAEPSAIFSADSPRDLTPTEYLAVAMLEAGALGPDVPDGGVMGETSSVLYYAVRKLIADAVEGVIVDMNEANLPESPDDSLVIDLEAAQRIREGVYTAPKVVVNYAY